MDRINPALKVPLFNSGEWRAWKEEECAAFEPRWQTGTMQRRAYTLALYAGQRRSDLVRMTRAHRKGAMLHVSSQEKTGEELWIPEHRELAPELARGEQAHMSLLTTSAGRAFDPVYFGAWFAEAIDAAGLPKACVLHGLRKTAEKDCGSKARGGRLHGARDNGRDRPRHELDGDEIHEGRQQEKAGERGDPEAGNRK